MKIVDILVQSSEMLIYNQLQSYINISKTNHIFHFRKFLIILIVNCPLTYVLNKYLGNIL